MKDEGVDWTIGFCSDCAYNGLRNAMSICRLNPPVVVGDGDGLVMTYWPEVDDEDWCSKFEAVSG